MKYLITDRGELINLKSIKLTNGFEFEEWAILDLDEMYDKRIKFLVMTLIDRHPDDNELWLRMRELQQASWSVMQSVVGKEILDKEDLACYAASRNAYNDTLVKLRAKVKELCEVEGIDGSI